MTLMESLTQLYEVDRQVRGLRSRLDSAERYASAQKRQLDEVEAQLEELRTRKRHLQAKIANLENDGAALDGQLEKFRGDLNAASTNKQYTAVLTEMNTVKESRGKIDDQILAEMGEIEVIEERLTEVEAQREERAKVVGLAETQLAERREEVGARLDELESEREVAADAVPGDALSVFDQLADAYEGEAMAQIEEIDRRRREYACGACNMHLPFEKISTLMIPSDTLVRCSACGRILFLLEEMRGALTPK